MTTTAEELFREDAYLRECEATVTKVADGAFYVHVGRVSGNNILRIRVDGRLVLENEPRTAACSRCLYENIFNSWTGLAENPNNESAVSSQRDFAQCWSASDLRQKYFLMLFANSQTDSGGLSGRGSHSRSAPNERVSGG